MNRIGVMQITDTLAIGGLERVAVNLANELPDDHYRSHCCATRHEGPLRQLLKPHVKYFHLERTGRFDPGALRRLIRYIAEKDIRILHAHGTSLFIAAAAAFRSRATLLWHDHFGRAESEQRIAWIYRRALRAATGVVAVTENLASWSRETIRMPRERVWYVPNFVPAFDSESKTPSLPGVPGARIVCAANLRPQKDHGSLIQAMKLVVQEFPEAHLILLGKADHETHLEQINNAIARENLASHISWLGPRLDVYAILRGCDIGVLSSASEGLPLALIEYGMAPLASVATNVGQCSEVLKEGKAGILVPPNSPASLADAITLLLRTPARRAAMAAAFSHHVRKEYGSDIGIKRICAIYDAILR